jgi:hypothetical protein
MQGIIRDVFEITGRGVIVLFDHHEDALLKVGDWLAVAGHKWKIAGQKIPRRVDEKGKVIEPLSIAVLLRGVTRAEVLPFVGRPFETIPGEIP